LLLVISLARLVFLVTTKFWPFSEAQFLTEA